MECLTLEMNMHDRLPHGRRLLESLSHGVARFRYMIDIAFPISDPVCKP